MNKILIIAALLISASVLAQAKTIYKWTDKDGRINYTDNPLNIPPERRSGAEALQNTGEDSSNFEIEEPAEDEARAEPDVKENLQKEGREREIREFWRSRAVELDNREKFLLQAIENTEQQIRQKRKEVDYMLINGFVADFSILELKSYQESLEGLKGELIFIDTARAQLRDEARRKGIPPGYLRP